MSTVPAPAVTHAESPFVAEEHRFRELLPELRRRFDNEFVVLLHGQAIDHGSDDEELAARAYARLGDAPFFIGWVGEAPMTYDLPSPEEMRPA